MTKQADQEADEALKKAWRNYYGNISPEIIPPIHLSFREAFEAGIEYAENKQQRNHEDSYSS